MPEADNLSTTSRAIPIQASNAIHSFSFDGGPVRVVLIDGEPHLVGRDVCERLGYGEPRRPMAMHCKGVSKRYPLQTAGGIQHLRVLAEPDVLRLIMHSKLPAAQRFERWVFEDVLPSIRRTGSYAQPQQAAPSGKPDAQAQPDPHLEARRPDTHIITATKTAAPSPAQTARAEDATAWLAQTAPGAVRGQEGPMTPLPVTACYARLAMTKQLWGAASDPCASTKYLGAGRTLSDAMTARRSQDIGEILLKLAELHEWIQEDASPSAKALLASAIADLEGIEEGRGEEGPQHGDPVGQPVPPAGPRPVPALAAAEAPVPTAPPPATAVAGGAGSKRPLPRFAMTAATVKVDNRNRPVEIDGVVYPSIIIASRTTGLTPYEVRKQLT
jgi:hypothetical protein